MERSREELYRRYCQLLRLAGPDNPNLNEREAARLAAARMASTYGLGDQTLAIQLQPQKESENNVSSLDEEKLKAELTVAVRNYNHFQEEYHSVQREFLSLRKKLKSTDFSAQTAFSKILKINKKLNEHYGETTYNIIDELRFTFNHRWFSTTEAMVVLRNTNRNEILQILYNCSDIEQKGERRSRRYRFAHKLKRG